MKVPLISLAFNFVIVGLASLIAMPRKTKQFAVHLNEYLCEYDK